MVDEVQKAGSVILEGGTILYPTDTIWGLGCDATNPEAIQKIYQIKQRSDRKSMLVLMDAPSMLPKYLEHFPGTAVEIIESVEKPTTIIYQGAKNLAHNLMAKDGSIGIRITSDPFCQQLIKHTGKPIVSTSANISGRPSPSSFGEIEMSVRQQVDYVVIWRQDETTPANPSAILKLGPQGEITVIRS